jgi:hypothetical protein
MYGGLSPHPIPLSATGYPHSFPQEVDWDIVTGQREVYIKMMGSNLLDISSLDENIAKRAANNLLEWVQMTPLDAQFAYHLSPGATASRLANKTYMYDANTTNALWYTMRTTHIGSYLNAQLDDPNIGAPSGTAATTYTAIRCAFLSKTYGGILPNPRGAWSTPSDDYAPTLVGIQAFHRYWNRQNYKPPTFNLFGIKATAPLALVEANFTSELLKDQDVKDLIHWVYGKEEKNPAISGMPRIYELDGMYFCEWQQYRSEFANQFPGYSAAYGSAGRAIYCAPVFSAGSFMTSIYNEAKVTPYERSAAGLFPSWLIWLVVGSKVLQDKIMSYNTSGTASATYQDRVSYLIYTAPGS